MECFDRHRKKKTKGYQPELFFEVGWGGFRKKQQMKKTIRPPAFENLATALPVTPSLPGPAEQFQNWREQGVKKIII